MELEKNGLKRSASTSDLFNLQNLTNLKLREAKSFADEIENIKLYDCMTKQFSKKGTCGEILQEAAVDGKGKFLIVTRDSFTNEILIINEDLLTCKGQVYSANRIARSWRKDCRMWLWKNRILGTKFNKFAKKLHDKSI